MGWRLNWKSSVNYIVGCVTEDIIWDVKGDVRIEGKGEFTEKLHELSGNKAHKLQIDQIITHGNIASANGTLHFAGGVTYAFCDVYVFTSEKNGGYNGNGD